MLVTVSIPETADVKTIVIVPAENVVLEVDVDVEIDEKLKKYVEVDVMVVDTVMYVVVTDVKILDEIVVVVGRA